MYNYLDSIGWLLIQQHKGQLFAIIWLHTFLCFRYKCRLEAESARKTDYRGAQLHFVITKGSDARITLSAPVNQNHPSRVMLEPKLELNSVMEIF